MCMLDEIMAKRDEIYAIARKHKAEKLWVFGSCARKEERPDSDVDFLVKFGDGVGFLEYSQLERKISEALGRKAELTVSRVLLNEPRFAARVCREAVAV
ncbi:MAG: nucleotidyltransferase domain-containing protein [Kiritimatiellae bacterium]|nr:nucleotidyltransferase domain-containing protein [Kiritimatiellia bacterium]